MQKLICSECGENLKVDYETNIAVRTYYQTLCCVRRKKFF